MSSIFSQTYLGQIILHLGWRWSYWGVFLQHSGYSFTWLGTLFQEVAFMRTAHHTKPVLGLMWQSTWQLKMEKLVRFLTPKSWLAHQTLQFSKRMFSGQFLPSAREISSSFLFIIWMLHLIILMIPGQIVQMWSFAKQPLSWNVGEVSFASYYHASRASSQPLLPPHEVRIIQTSRTKQLKQQISMKCRWVQDEGAPK